MYAPEASGPRQANACPIASAVRVILRTSRLAVNPTGNPTHELDAPPTKHG